MISVLDDVGGVEHKVSCSIFNGKYMNEASNERAIKSCLQTSRETYERPERKKKTSIRRVSIRAEKVFERIQLIKDSYVAHAPIRTRD